MFFQLPLFLKHFFSYAAGRADPFFGDLFEWCAGRDSAFGVTFEGVVDPAAGDADVSVHRYGRDLRGCGVDGDGCEADGFISFRDFLPVDEIPAFLDEFSASVAAVDVVGMFPDVDGENGLVAGCHRVAGVGFLEDVELAFVVGGQPCPSGSEDAERGFLEHVFKTFE